MNRRRFFALAVSSSALFLTGCRRLLSTQPETPNLGKVRIEQPPGEGGGGTITVLLMVTVGTASLSLAVPYGRTLSVGQALDWAKSHAGLDVDYGVHPTRGRYVNRLLGKKVDDWDVPTLLYAVGPVAFATEDDWYAGMGNTMYVDHQLLPANGVIDWRLMVP